MKKYSCYELKSNKFGRYFIKNNQFYYLDSFDIWGLDNSIWYDKIEYKFYKVNFIKENNKEFIQLRKNAKTKELEKVWC